MFGMRFHPRMKDDLVAAEAMLRHSAAAQGYRLTGPIETTDLVGDFQRPSLGVSAPCVKLVSLRHDPLDSP